MNNSVTLLGYYGGDETHCLSAWQSTNIELGVELSDEIAERIHYLFQETVIHKKKSPEELLKMLAESGHHSVFEKSTLHFQIAADIATHIHCLKHRIGVSINSESARYKELWDKWYLPSDWNEEWTDRLIEHIEKGHELYHQAIAELSPTLGRKRAKESARYFLPYAKQLDFDMMFNFRSFAHFQSLRNSEHAQKEVREIAQLMLEQVKSIDGNPFQYTLTAFGF